MVKPLTYIKLNCKKPIIPKLFRLTDIIEQKRLQWYGHVKRIPEERIPKLIMDWIPQERRKGGRPRNTWITRSQDNKKFRTRSMENYRGMAFGFRKTVTTVKQPEKQIRRQADR